MMPEEFNLISHLHNSNKRVTLIGTFMQKKTTIYDISCYS